MPSLFQTVTTTSLFVLGPVIYFFYQWRRANQSKQLQRAEDELHPLLKNHTTFRSYTTKHHYPLIRTFYRPHPRRDKHEDIAQLPLIVFIHGLGGVLPQFAPLLQSLTNIAPCFGLELPGHGRSKFAPSGYDAYTIESNVALWKVAIEEVCEDYGHSSVVIIGHSMGCAISSLLASTTSTTPSLSVTVLGMISICPRARQVSEHEVDLARRLAHIPNLIVNVLRWFDRRGGTESTSVRRVLGDSKELDLKRIQLQWNRQFRTAVLKRITLGVLPAPEADGTIRGGYPPEAVWHGLHTPLFLIAGEADKVTPPSEIDNIIRFITDHSLEQWQVEARTANNSALVEATNGLVPTTIKYLRNHKDEAESVIQAITVPAPASHALLYAHTTYRLVSALIESFLATHVSEKLDFAYQLRLLTTAGKWDVKNLQKWKAVLPVSGPINTKLPYGSSNGLFRALKTMREQDDEHNPTLFIEQWASKVYAVVDISHDAPVYNAKTLDKGGIEYHKYATVSKTPPSALEVQDFCSLVDKLVTERNAKADDQHSEVQPRKSIAVHCHYGYNRTGFFICSYLISRCGYTVQQAIDEFAEAKPPGIKHEHFLDQLWLRFASGAQQETKAHADYQVEKRKVKMAVLAEDELTGGERPTSGHASEGDVM